MACRMRSPCWRCVAVAIVIRCDEDDGDSLSLNCAHDHAIQKTNSDNTPCPSCTHVTNHGTDQRDGETNEFVCLAGTAIDHASELSWSYFPRLELLGILSSCEKALHDRLRASLEINVRMPKVELLQTVLHGCVTWTPNTTRYSNLRTEHHHPLLHGVSVRR